MSFRFPVPATGWLWTRPEPHDTDDVPSAILWRGDTDCDSEPPTMPDVPLFDIWLQDQADHDNPDVRRCAWRASSRRSALYALHEKRGDWPTFVDYAHALGMDGESDMLHALGVTWWEWRNAGNAS